jgi:F-type H+-transporting ATPase subunit delta
MHKGNSSIAYPYANAIFEIAKADNSIDKWLSYLFIMSNVSRLEGFKLAVSNPTLSKKMIVNILLDAIDSKEQFLNSFINLLVQNNRIGLLNSIYLSYKNIVDQYLNNDYAIIETAFVIDDKDKKDLEDILSKKFGKNISATIKVNPDLIGGIKIILDDIVIDSSIKGNISRMFSKVIK